MSSSLPSLPYPPGRILLLLNGLALTSTGLSYIMGRDRQTLKSLDALFNEKAKFNGGINLIAPFAGCAYLSTSVVNIIAALKFGDFECRAVMITTGAFFHLAMAAVRVGLMGERKLFYRDGKVKSMSTTQVILGLALLWGASRVG
ncbi:hypothetical protein TrCOL_g11018 [Triparma columacea]|uniref:Uncharacterized protein n=1 Tax=Triparma columacea TaxID=722753 RepID=A0A9W7L9X0_9STRA|nr:hypothetical protein TrCOL_g11018 [Triparma columacea]